MLKYRKLQVYLQILRYDFVTIHTFTVPFEENANRSS